MPLPHGWLDQSRNFLGLEEPWCRPDQAGIYIVPAPYEHTSSYLTGYVRPAAQVDALTQAGFTDVRIYDNAGRRTTAEAKDKWLYYRGVKP